MGGPVLYYIRHGQTDWNAEQRFQGQKDIPLNDTGRAQALHNGATLAGMLGDARGFQFISSPLQRARETMEIVRTRMELDPLAYQTDPRLTEVSYGNLEGVTQAEMKAQDRELYYYRKQNAWTFRPEGGESQMDVKHRVFEWYQSLEPDGKYIITAHGAIGRVVRHLLAGFSPDEVSRFAFPQDKVFRFEDGSETLY